MRVTNNEIVKHVNEKVLQNFQSLAETLSKQMEHYITSKLEIISKEIRSQLDLKSQFAFENIVVDKNQVILRLILLSEIGVKLVFENCFKWV